MALVILLACCCMTLICYAAAGHVPCDAESRLYRLIIARIISQSQNMSTRTEVNTRVRWRTTSEFDRNRHGSVKLEAETYLPNTLLSNGARSRTGV